MPSYESFPFESFGEGLNLRDKADAVSESQAIDCLNVIFTERGAVKQRDGYDNLTSSALTNAVKSLHPYYTSSGTKQLLAGCGTRLEALNTSGGVVASATALTDGVHDFARFGTPNSEVAYAGNGDDLLYKWNGTAWASVASTPKAGALAVAATSNRLVAGRFNTTTGGPTGGAGTSSPSHVYFSDAGAPDTWGTNNYIQVTPGDGEKVQAVIAWREYVLIFKETKFFVHHGERTDSSGNPIFDYYPVDAGVGLASPRAICADEFGVYFMSREGVYRTTGGEPEKLSDLIDPIFLGGSSDFYTGGELAHGSITNCAMAAHNNKIYLAFPTSSANDRILVFDPRYEWWSIWDIGATCLSTFRVSNTEELVFGFTATNDVGRHSSTYTNDNGTAISSHWRSGWFDYGTPDIKTIRETKGWGEGKVFVSVSRDFEQGVGSQTQLDFSDPDADTWGGTTWGGGTWATPAVLNPALRRYAVRGTAFSTYFTNSTLDQTWAVHRLTHHVRGIRPPSIRKTDES